MSTEAVVRDYARERRAWACLKKKAYRFAYDVGIADCQRQDFPEEEWCEPCQKYLQEQQDLEDLPS